MFFLDLERVNLRLFLKTASIRVVAKKNARLCYFSFACMVMFTVNCVMLLFVSARLIKNARLNYAKTVRLRLLARLLVC